MRLAAALVLSIALVFPAKPKAAVKRCTHGNALERQHCRAHVRCSNRNPEPCITNSGIHYRLNRLQRAWMRRVAWCESRMQPEAANGPHSGMYQFRTAPPSTWETTPYRGRSPFSAKFSSLAAAWMLRAGRGSEWACA